MSNLLRKLGQFDRQLVLKTLLSQLQLNAVIDLYYVSIVFVKEYLNIFQYIKL